MPLFKRSKSRMGRTFGSESKFNPRALQVFAIAFLFLAVGFLFGRATGNFGFSNRPFLVIEDGPLGIFLVTFFIGLGMFGVTVAVRSLFLFFRRFPVILKSLIAILVIYSLWVFAYALNDLGLGRTGEVIPAYTVGISLYTLALLYALTETPVWAWGFLQIFCFPLCAAFSNAPSAEAYFWELYIGISLIGVFYAPARLSIERFLRPRMGAL